MQKILEEIQNSINKNKDCQKVTSLMSSKVRYTEKGHMSSKDKEILALLSDNHYGKYFWAHVFKNHFNNKWVSLIAMVPISPNETTMDVLFEDYAHTVISGQFASCTIQNKHEAFKEDTTFLNACLSLKVMIESYDTEKRLSGYEDNQYNWMDDNEMRIYGVYL